MFIKITTKKKESLFTPRVVHVRDGGTWAYFLVQRISFGAVHWLPPGCINDLRDRLGASEYGSNCHLKRCYIFPWKSFYEHYFQNK